MKCDVLKIGPLHRPKVKIEATSQELKFFKLKFQILDKGLADDGAEEMNASIDSAQKSEKKADDSDNEDLDNFLEKHYHLNFEEFTESTGNDLQQKRERLLKGKQ